MAAVAMWSYHSTTKEPPLRGFVRVKSVKIHNVGARKPDRKSKDLLHTTLPLSIFSIMAGSTPIWAVVEPATLVVQGQQQTSYAPSSVD
ncbi:hypothetical protein TNCV_1627321 [Trichonephila clavipes]|nr:hypothetical protein TNCV_1627321 [Trichonephila clavipes]